MLDVASHVPMCESYTTNLYSRAMQELEESSIADYDSDKVLNLDEDEQTNFVVYSEKIKIIEFSPNKNKVEDLGNGSYIVTNADNSFTELRVGDIFLYQYENGSVLIVKVKSISVDGTTVAITEEQDIDLENVFDYVKIEGSLKQYPVPKRRR